MLVAFPLRLLAKIRMMKSEIAVTLVTLTIVVVSLVFYPAYYSKTYLLKVFYYILVHPIPYWSIILLSTIGTFLSIYFGDEMLDVAHHSEREKYSRHKKKYILVVTLFLFLFLFFLYKILIHAMGIKIGV